MTKTEIAALEEAHRVAQARLGQFAGYLALLEWEGVNPANPAGTAARWTATALRLIAAARRKSRRAAVAYYRLARALDTGFTVPIPGAEGGGKTTLDALRKEVTDALLDIAGLDTEKGIYDNEDEDFFESLARDGIPGSPFDGTSIDQQIQDLLDAMGSDGSVKIDAGFEWEPMVLQGEALETAYKGLLEALVLDHQKNKVGKMPADMTPQETLEWLQEGHGKTGVIAAGIVDQAGIDAGRDTITSAMGRDSKVRTVARGTSPGACGFCTMLASRGWAYVSASAAGSRSKSKQEKAIAEGQADDGEIHKYHPHCHCYPIVRWVDGADLPESNAYYNKMWRIVVENYPGKDAFNSWRNWIDAGQPPIE